MMRTELEYVSMHKYDEENDDFEEVDGYFPAGVEIVGDSLEELIDQIREILTIPKDAGRISYWDKEENGNTRYWFEFDSADREGADKNDDLICRTVFTVEGEEA